MTSAELGAIARRFARLERRLFEVLGGWVPSVPEPRVKLFLRVQSFRHAWHAQLWDEVAPAGAIEPGRGGDLEDGGLPGLIERVAAPTATSERLAGAYDLVLPRVVAAYEGVRDGANPASDRPLMRALGLMLDDHRAALDEGAALRSELGIQTGDTGAAADVDRLEGLLGATGDGSP